MGISFARYTSTPDTSLGVTDVILNSLPSGINIWGITSKTDTFSKNREEGRVNLFLFDERSQPSIRKIKIDASNIVKKCGKNLPENIIIRDHHVKNLEGVRYQGVRYKGVRYQGVRYQGVRYQGVSIMYSDQPKHVFISYSTRDSKVANRIRSELEANGIESFLAEKSLKGVTVLVT